MHRADLQVFQAGTRGLRQVIYVQGVCVVTDDENHYICKVVNIKCLYGIQITYWNTEF